MDKKNIEDIFPLTPMQSALLAHALVSRRNGLQDGGFLQVRCTLEGPLDIALLERAWQSVVRRHPALRTSVHWEGADQPLHVVHKEVPLHFEERSEHVDDFLRSDRERGLELTSAPVSRITLIKMGVREHSLVWSCHHLLLDGWSASMILQEWFKTYSNRVRGTELELPRPGSFREFVAWQKKQGPGTAEDFWRAQLSGFSQPTPLPLETSDSKKANGARMMEATLSENLVEQVLALARKCRVTPNTVFTTAWGLALAEFARGPEVVIGITVSGRPAELPGVKNTAGMFMGIVPFRLKAPGAHQSIGDWLASIHAILSESQTLAPISPVDLQKWSSVPGRVRLFQSLFVFENFPWDGTFGMHGGELRVRDFEGDFTSSYPLTCIVKPGAPWSVEIRCKEKVMDGKLLTQLFQKFQGSLEQLCHPDERYPWPQPAGSPNQKSNDRRSEDAPAVKVKSARNHREFLVSTLFEDLLGGDPVGIHDDFFELGGTSLLAVRLFSELQEKTGLALPLSTLFEAPTVEGIAAKLDAENWTPPWSSLVPIRPGGNKTPFYLVHGVGGNLLDLRHLVRHLEANRPAYGLQSVAMDGTSPPLTRFEDMAAHYVREIRDFQPDGPYAIGGLCLGGIIAYEMACQLVEAGQKVALLALLDASTPHAFRALPKSDQLRHNVVSYGERLRYHASRIVLGPGRRQHVRARVRAVGKRLKSKRWQRDYEQQAQSKEPLDLPKALRDVREANIFALERFEPRRYSGDLTLFRPSEAGIGTFREPTLGWGYLVDGEVNVIDSPGNHVTIVKEPHVRALASQLNAILRSVDEEKEPEPLMNANER